jgi:predicted ATPase
MDMTGQGIAYALVDILHNNRKNFDELEERLRQLVPNIQRIVLPRGENQTFLLELVDRYSEHHIPAADISDGTLRILALLTALYQENTPSIICFEEIENGVHPWLLHKVIELLKIVSVEGITGQPVQIFITTHSPVLLNYVEPSQVRAVELDNEGKTQVHSLPIDSVRFQKALEAYDGELGELWFTNTFGANPV